MNNTSKQKNTQKRTSSFELKSLFILSVLLMAVLTAGWYYSIQIRQSINAKKNAVHLDVQVLVDIEKLRNSFESQVDNSLLYFLMGSSSLLDEQNKNKQEFLVGLAQFEEKYKLPKLNETIKNLRDHQTKVTDFYKQAAEHRNNKTESKIVGQFFRAKTNPIKSLAQKDFDQLIASHNSEVKRAESFFSSASAEAEEQIPKGMTWLALAVATLFFLVVLLTLKVLRERPKHLAERTRLFNEAQTAIHRQDEVISAVSQEFKEPIQQIVHTAKTITQDTSLNALQDKADFIQITAFCLEDRVQSIIDQSKKSANHLVIRVEQRGVDSLLEEARLVMQPMAKQKNIRLEFGSVNHSVLAFVDSQRVMRVFTAIIGNAIKFSPRNSKIIIKTKSDSQFAFITVRDFGPGIPDEQLRNIFNQHWQAPKTAELGAGVGLATIKTIVEAHGGSITVESHIGHGSTFTFTLPRRRPTNLQIGKSTAPERFSTKPISPLTMTTLENQKMPDLI